jgi:hypothetical protein
MALATVAWALLVLGGAVACGGGPVEGQKTWVDRPAAAPKDAKKLIKSEEQRAVEVHENPRWDLLEKHFRRFARRPASTQKDTFKSRLDKYVEKIEIKEIARQGDDGEEKAIEKVEELNPLKKFPADDYRLVAIMTGIGTPAALIRDPKGAAYTIRVDSEVGNEGGVVESITQYEVVVTNPSESLKPIRLNIRPGMFELSQRQIQERALQEEPPEELPGDMP